MGVFKPYPEHSSGYNQNWWTKIWNLKIPPKMKIFNWRAIHNFLPTKFNLASHHIPVIDQCSMCHSLVTSNSHAMFFCRISKPVWKFGIFWDLLGLCQRSSFIDIIYGISNYFFDDDLGVFCAMSWAIWREICKRKHDSSLVCSLVKVDWVCTVIMEFKGAHLNVNLQSVGLVEARNARWVKPPAGHFRLDVDVGFNEDKGKFSIGAIIQDDFGKIITAKESPIRNPGSVFRGELWAILHGLWLCISNVWIFFDSLEATRVVMGKFDFLGPEGNLISEIKELLVEDLGILGHQAHEKGGK
ncbi:uncharacterized protein [Henckelia pumila]|uniref:uncharacterized protein n=1 Tax=Henckelia pumila TaxID=405737 RepID=UPI003C6E7FD3